MPAKYQDQIRSMFVSVLRQDAFFYNVDPDPAIDLTLLRMDQTYQSLSDDIEIGIRNGCPADAQLQMYAEAVTVFLTLPD